ncbi:hypothetical protein T09_3532 [Trichinella sp. T9]|nr:hypothetical protein T09_3532 [Trichinella sp. T9]
MDNPDIALCEEELGPVGVPFPVYLSELALQVRLMVLVLNYQNQVRFWAVCSMHQMDYVCYRLLKIFIHLKDAQGTLCGRLRFGIGNPGIALCEGELGPDGVPFPGIGIYLSELALQVRLMVLVLNYQNQVRFWATYSLAFCINFAMNVIII